MSNNNTLTNVNAYRILGVPHTASLDEIKKAYQKLAMKHHPNKGGNTKRFQNISRAYIKIGPKSNTPAPLLKARAKAVANNTTLAIHEFFTKTAPSVATGNGNVRTTNTGVGNGNVRTTNTGVGNGNVRTTNTGVGNGNVRNNNTGVGNGNVRNNNTNWNLPNPQGEGMNNMNFIAATSVNGMPLGFVFKKGNKGLGWYRNKSAQPLGPSAKPKTSFWNRFSGVKLPSFRSGNRGGGGGGGGNTTGSGWFKSLFGDNSAKCVATVNFIPSKTFKGNKSGFVFKTQYGVNANGKQFPCTGYYRNRTRSQFGPNVKPTTTTAAANKNKNKNKKNAGAAGVTVTTSATGGAGGASTSAGGTGGASAGGAGGSVSFAPVIKVNVPQAASQAATQALPPLERAALMNAGGYQSAATAISNAGGPSTVERAINALENANGNINVAAERSGISRNALVNVKKLGGPATARRTLTAVAKVTRNTTPYVNKGAVQRVAPNVYALTSQTQKKRKHARRYKLSVSELDRVINAVKKKKLISLVAHNVTGTNIHANNGRLKPYYKRVIKAAVLKTPFAQIARGHAKKLVLSAPVKRRRTTRYAPNTPSRF